MAWMLDLNTFFFLRPVSSTSESDHIDYCFFRILLHFRIPFQPPLHS